MRLRSSVGAAEQVDCRDAAQRLGSLADRRGVGAGTGYQADREPDVRQGPLRAQCAQRVGRGKDYLDIGAPRLQAGKELGYIGTEEIAAAFDEHGVSRQREAEIERIAEEVADPAATHRIGARQPEIEAIERLRRAEILV